MKAASRRTQLNTQQVSNALIDLLDGALVPITSPIAVFEAALGICRKHHASIAESQEDVRQFLQAAGIRAVRVTASEAEAALDAFWRRGKGRGHPAQLNLGDCFAYAMPKNHGGPLLFKGEDFDKPDISSDRAASPTAAPCGIGSSARSSPDSRKQGGRTIYGRGPATTGWARTA